MNVIFFGTPDFAAHILDHLIDCGILPVAVVTKPDKPFKRGKEPHPPAVKRVVTERIPEVALYQPDKASTPSMERLLQQHAPDLFIVVAYGEIIKKALLELPSKGCINIHASLLPALRGASPIQQAIIDGYDESGVSIIEMSEQMDAGDILAKQAVAITEDMTAGDLEKALCDIAKSLVVDVVRQIEAGTVRRAPQDHTQASYVKKIHDTACQIDWAKPARVIHNLVRGLQPKPGAWCLVRHMGCVKRLKIIRSTVRLERRGEPRAVLQYDKNGIVIAAGDGALQIEELQLEGKRKMTAREFVCGMPAFTIEPFR